MAPRMQTIEVDESTAAMLSARAAESGVSVASLIRDLIALFPEDLSDDAQILELEQRSRAHHTKPESEQASHEAVTDWLHTWGTPAFKPWSK